MPKSIVFPPVAPHWVFERDCLQFPALVDGTIINCLVSGEALWQHFGARGMNAQEARRAFQDHQSAIQEAARGKIAAGELNTRGEVLLKMADFTGQTTTTTPAPSKRAPRISLSAKLETTPALKDLIVNASRVLEDELAGTPFPVAAEWKPIPVSTGDTLGLLTLRDLETGAAVERLFTPADLKSQRDVRFAVFRLWDDLLQERARMLVAALPGTAAVGE